MNIIKRIIVVLLILFIPTMPTLAQKIHKTSENKTTFEQNNAHINTLEIENKVDSLMMPLVDEGIVSGSILIAIRGNILFSKGYGLADREHNIPNKSETIFRICSITKTITAISIMQLQEKHKLNIHDKLNNYLDDFPNGDKITIYHLLNHTSGIPSYNWLRSDNKPQELEVVINWVKELELKSVPGEKFMYSNSGYALLTLIIEKVSGMKYEDYIKENIFIPCNMENTGLYLMNNPLKNMAFGYGRVNYNGFNKVERTCPLAKGDGDLYSTVTDLYKYVMAFYNDKIISQESRKQMLNAHKNNCALGWFVDKLQGEEVVYHDGGGLGYMNNMISFKDNELLVIYLFNSDFLLSHIVEEQLAAIALRKPWQPLFKKEYDKSSFNSFKTFAGEYTIDQSSNFTISVENGNIYFQVTGQPICKAFLFAENYIYIKEINSRIRFEKSEEGKIQYTALFGLFLVTGERNTK